ncbi:hypothetical protein M0638_02060 [Roseomonas sp. NAR14]|uniref:Uncharacterized protein n=1 Tax=Roseomonas acroporae TaxID=2937791 RepID=A0A9X2BS17_9PROT|nr:hypothetical protein [Roseomonas acroporae]MCK8783163.1 hypothetical protein [Roseomonas acroporae]
MTAPGAAGRPRRAGQRHGGGGEARRVWLAPATLALLSLVGLVSALLGDEVWDVLSWGALSVPLATITWYALKR